MTNLPDGSRMSGAKRTPVRRYGDAQNEEDPERIPFP
jgi:hypothetical protein